ncbi:MAG: Jag N-terminal domain-containing protein [Candidatus Coatesbacteria bacterium]|nr:MAG: Jag N-terminal domain-containing protein [Candidatus Coatesbacteria bacterium]
MRTVEVEGNSRVDATRRGLELLGADIDDVRVEVIREEPRGLLGFLGFKRVTVRVSLVEENPLELAAEVINKLVSFLPVPVEAQVQMRKHTVYLELSGRELREFQKQEDVADALGHILELFLNRSAKNKIVVKAGFAEDHLSREEELRRLARAAADRVASRHREEALPAMSPRDRRTVHMTLETDDRVVTESAGKGNKRHVVVYPARAKKPKGEKPPDRKADRKPERQPDRKPERQPDRPAESRARPPSRPRSQQPKDKDKGDPAAPKKAKSRRRRRRPKKGPAGDKKPPAS